jgi:hypothetical protein
MVTASPKRVPKKEQKSVEKSSCETITVNIDRSAFEDGYDPLIKTIDYGYSSMGSKQVPDGKRLAKIKYGKTAVTVFNKWLTTNKGDKGKSGKQKPFIFDKLSKKPVCNHEFGECLIGAANKTKAGFKVMFMNKKGSDSYVHHVSILANSENEQCIHSLDMIGTVSTSKNELDARTISHICGNGGCARPGHLKIETKRVNDERCHCHFLLRRSLSENQSEMIRMACPHEPKCFVNIYTINTPYY